MPGASIALPSTQPAPLPGRNPHNAQSVPGPYFPNSPTSSDLDFEPTREPTIKPFVETVAAGFLDEIIHRGNDCVLENKTRVHKQYRTEYFHDKEYKEKRRSSKTQKSVRRYEENIFLSTISKSSFLN
ncbi:Hypothetical protein NTJ_12417 [Nesidiocoris tenuis]|uniref:Uncharacterized protein n=1 Tax=Nesidiocoris tenuis TaxID=355587 RepID=A0ABN7B8R9_9HEMI|nr:Hypothetical protein NTJ_12417 [Nesidiocoris tenuis]